MSATTKRAVPKPSRVARVVLDRWAMHLERASVRAPRGWPAREREERGSMRVVPCTDTLNLGLAPVRRGGAS